MPSFQKGQQTTAAGAGAPQALPRVSHRRAPPSDCARCNPPPASCLLFDAFCLYICRQVETKLSPFLKTCGYNVKKDVYFLPISGLHGHGMKEASLTRSHLAKSAVLRSFSLSVVFQRHQTRHQTLLMRPV